MVKPVGSTSQIENLLYIQENRLFGAVAARNSLKFVILGIKGLKYIQLMGNYITHFVIKQFFLKDAACTKYTIPCSFK